MGARIPGYRQILRGSVGYPSSSPLQEHDPARGRAAAAVLVLGETAAAVPMLPPDPFEVVHLEDEEREDPEQDLGARHVKHRTVRLARGQWAGWPKVGAPGS